MNVKAQSCPPKGRAFWPPSPEPPQKPSSAPVWLYPRHEDLGRPREIEIPAARKGICMWLLWKLLQSGSACSTGVKKVEVIVLHLVGILCMTQA